MSYSLDTIRLLVAHDSQDDAEQLINALRNAGRASRAELVLNEDGLLKALKSGNWELFLCRPTFGDCDATSALSHLKRLGKSPCTLIITDDFSAKTVYEMLEAGAQAAVPQQERELLFAIIEQQLETIRLRRELQQSEIDRHEAEKRLSVLMDQSRDAIAYVVDGMHIHANEAYLELFGYKDVDDLAGVPIMDMVSSDDHDSLKKLLRSRAQDENQTHEINCKGRNQDGKEFNASFVFSPSTFDGEACSQIVIHTEEGMDEDTLRQLTMTDPTTGLPNRSWLLDQLDQKLALAMNQGESSAIFYLRVDNFDNFQGSLGIEGADTLLTKLADALQGQVKNAPFARVSGEEFALVESIDDPDDANKRADELRTFIEQLMPEVKARTLKVTVTIGVAFIREDSHNGQAALTKALECCNKARAQSKSGGNAVLVHNPLDDLKEGSSEAVYMRLQQALEKNGLQLQFLGIMNMQDENDHFFEVFVKLPKEDGTFLEPSQFMPVASEHGIASKVDRWVALNAMKQAAALPDKVRLLINISGYSLRDAKFSDWLIKAIRATKLDAKNITFQLNEGDANTFLKQVGVFSNSINKAGCNLSISRFGGSPNPFGLFDKVSAQMVKFEGSFTQELNNKEQRDKFGQLVKKTQDSKKEVLVGFVESAEQMQLLWTLGGINYLQGYYLAQPEDTLAANVES